MKTVHLGPDARERAIQHSVRWLFDEEIPEVALGLCPALEREQRQGQTAACQAVVAFEPEGSVVFSDGAVEVASHGKGLSA